MVKKDFILYSTDNEKLRITAYGLEHHMHSPCIIYIHGFKGFKDWGFVPYTAQYLAEKGFFVITFNFSHNGIGDNPLEFTESDKFANNTLSKEVRELTEVINAYKYDFFGEVKNSSVGLLGHSWGGGISLITAQKDPYVKAVAVWSSVSKFDRYSERQKEEWRRKGYFEITNNRTLQVMRLNLPLLNDIEMHKETTLDLEKAVKELNKPLFIAHGEEDLTVPIGEGEEIFNWADKELSEFRRIPNTGHTFNVSHPFENSNEKFDSLLEKTHLFFYKNLIM